jgi:hypothetical protein
LQKSQQRAGDPPAKASRWRAAFPAAFQDIPLATDMHRPIGHFSFPCYPQVEALLNIVQRKSPEVNFNGSLPV